MAPAGGRFNIQGSELRLRPQAQFHTDPGAMRTPPSQLQEAGVLPTPRPFGNASTLAAYQRFLEKDASTESLHINYDLHKERRPGDYLLM